MRPRQVRYQAALRPDMTSRIDSKVLSNAVPPRNHDFWLRPCTGLAFMRSLNKNRAFVDRLVFEQTSHSTRVRNARKTAFSISANRIFVTSRRRRSSSFFYWVVTLLTGLCVLACALRIQTATTKPIWASNWDMGPSQRRSRRLPVINLGMRRPLSLVRLWGCSAGLLLPANPELPLALPSARRLLRVGSIHIPGKPPWRWRRHKWSPPR
jgi:hypothetical protein